MKININRYPSIKNYLLGFGIDRLSQTGKILECGNKARKKTPHRWFELQDNCAYHEQFSENKIVYSEISQLPNFHYDVDGYYVEATGYIMTGNNLKYLILFLNSLPGFYFYSKFYVGSVLGKTGVRYMKHFLECLPVPKMDDYNKVNTLANNIIDAGGATISHNQQINKLFYNLFDLNNDEINLIEKSTRVFLDKTPLGDV